MQITPHTLLGHVEQKAMDQYIQETIALGHIHLSTSLMAAGFFFLKKKDGNLRPCIDYQGLNAVTQKDHHPLPLNNLSFHCLQEARVFSKLVLLSAYNLVCIRAGDEWRINLLPGLYGLM